MVVHRATLLPMILRKRRNWRFAERFASRIENGATGKPLSSLRSALAAGSLCPRHAKMRCASSEVQITSHGLIEICFQDDTPFRVCS